MLPRLLPGITALAALGLALQAAPAMAGQRLDLEGSTISIQKPEGWIVAPVSSSQPQLTLNLCDPLVREGCLLRGEMRFHQLLEAQAPASLDAVYADALAAYEGAAPEQRLAPPSRIKVAGHDAVEVSRIAQAIYDYVGGGGSTVQEGYLAVTVQDGTSFYRCAATAQPERVMGLRADLLQFCNSIQINGSSSQSGQQ